VLRILRGSNGCPVPVDDRELASIRILLLSQIKLIQWKHGAAGAMVIIEMGRSKARKEYFAHWV